MGAFLLGGVLFFVHYNGKGGVLFFCLKNIYVYILNKRYFKDVNREFDEFGVNTDLCKRRCWYVHVIYYMDKFFIGRGPIEKIYSGVYIIKKNIHSSCEIEDFVETHLCKLCMILRSRVVRVVCPH